MSDYPPLTIGLPRMRKEPGERRDFLPSFVNHLANNGVEFVLEREYGLALGLSEDSYIRADSRVRFANREEVFSQSYVLVLRYPEQEAIDLLSEGACLITMMHYPTRPERVALFTERGLEAMSLDSVTDDVGRRLVENLRAVAWNGTEIAFRTLAERYPAPGLDSPDRPPITVTLMGAGAVGSHVVGAAARYGSRSLHQQLASAGVPGVKVDVVDYDLTSIESVMLDQLAQTDILIDATQRPDASKHVIPNDWLRVMPEHAVLLDLSVDPYNHNSDPPAVKGIEGIPQGNLDQYVFHVDDPAYDKLPDFVSTTNRRTTVSCYSWPGIYPAECMEVYGRQIAPLIRTLARRGGIDQVSSSGRFIERAITRARLSTWSTNGNRKS